ncbi:MAG TPA: Zn-ribbon domain-containing OB-fold protein [Acidimicrobiales bacterium]|nr:Zn-ribbon domain-containing OB-fold protein [Acidimicrobiales bacterium]
MDDPYVRVLPTLNPDNEFFWTSGRDNVLRFLRCRACDYFVHPPRPYCPRCGGRNLAPETVSGWATVHTFTVNHQPWDGSRDPYVIAIVAIEEQDDVRLTTNIVGCAPDDVYIGMPVHVVFADHDPVWLPLFQPEHD